MKATPEQLTRINEIVSIFVRSYVEEPDPELKYFMGKFSRDLAYVMDKGQDSLPAPKLLQVLQGAIDSLTLLHAEGLADLRAPDDVDDDDLPLLPAAEGVH